MDYQEWEAMFASQRRKIHNPNSRWWEVNLSEVGEFAVQTRVRLVGSGEERRAIGVVKVRYKTLWDNTMHEMWFGFKEHEPMETMRPWLMNERLAEFAVLNVYHKHREEIWGEYGTDPEEEGE